MARHPRWTRRDPAPRAAPPHCRPRPSPSASTASSSLSRSAYLLAGALPIGGAWGCPPSTRRRVDLGQGQTARHLKLERLRLERRLGHLIRSISAASCCFCFDLWPSAMSFSQLGVLVPADAAASPRRASWCARAIRQPWRRPRSFASSAAATACLALSALYPDFERGRPWGRSRSSPGAPPFLHELSTSTGASLSCADSPRHLLHLLEVVLGHLVAGPAPRRRRGSRELWETLSTLCSLLSSPCFPGESPPPILSSRCSHPPASPEPNDRRAPFDERE